MTCTSCSWWPQTAARHRSLPRSRCCCTLLTSTTVFLQPHYRAAISEATSPGTAVLRLSASNADELGSPNSEVRYVLEGDVATLALLLIDAWSGAVSTRSRLDRERLVAFELCVVVQDGGVPPRAAACRLSMRMEDANDNEQCFERAVYCSRHARPPPPPGELCTAPHRRAPRSAALGNAVLHSPPPCSNSTGEQGVRHVEFR